MNIQFFGACDSVTGSQHILEIGNRKLLLECGLYQGRRADMEKINRNFPFHPTSIDAVILSHAHIDHSGNLPNLVKHGFSGPIYCTDASAKMLKPMLIDSAKIQEHDIRYLNKKNRKMHIPWLEPIFTEEDAKKVFGLVRPMKYHEWFSPAPNVNIYFQEAGHILGSALITFRILENKNTIKLGYSGDLGRKFLPILRDPEQITDIDYLVCESTYGDRLHNDVKSSYDELAGIIQQTSKRGGKIIIPSFAVERAQELLYIIHKLKDSRKIPNIPVYLDSPLSVKIVEVFAQCIDYYDDETRKEFISQNENPFIFSNLHLVESTEESQKLNFMHDPCIIISASGMCEFGRIRHHLKNNLENPNNTVAIVGYQAKDTLGRKLLEGEKEVNILDTRISVKSQIVVFNSLSDHADQNDLVEFIRKASPRKKLFLVHGEEKSKLALINKLKGTIALEMIIPKTAEIFEL